MSAEIKVPTFPESVEEGTLTTWYKKEGDAVDRDEKVADIETDKIVLEVSAPSAGVLSDVQVNEGDAVKPQQVLASVAEGKGASKGTKKLSDKADEAKPQTSAKKEADQAGDKKKAEPKAQAAGNGAQPGSAAIKVSPAVRRLLREHELDPADIEGTGRGGMITKADVLSYLEAPKESKSAEATPQASAPEPVSSATEAATAQTAGGERPEKRVPMTRIRARIAERLVEAQQSAAILSTFNEVNMQPIMDLRALTKKDFEQKHGAKLGFMSFFVKAAVAALKKFPVVNATLDGSDIIYHGYYDVGVAVSTDRGLVVPILRDADSMSYADIEKQIVDFAGRAREGKLTMEDLTGGTFSITNGGIFGSLLSTPILNPPQSAILGMHKIQERPVAENGQVVIRPVMYLALSYDHRLIDGRDAVQFLVEIKQALEHPGRALLDL